MDNMKYSVRIPTTIGDLQMGFFEKSYWGWGLFSRGDAVFYSFYFLFLQFWR